MARCRCRLVLSPVRQLTQQYGVVMILDEVITGFRWSPGGLQKLGIVPDLCTLAKILTGGLPGGAVAGRDEVMQVMAQTGDPEHDPSSASRTVARSTPIPTVRPRGMRPCASSLPARCRPRPTAWPSACARACATLSTSRKLPPVSTGRRRHSTSTLGLGPLLGTMPIR